jgi:hypothetical protein
VTDETDEAREQDGGDLDSREIVHLPDGGGDLELPFFIFNPDESLNSLTELSHSREIREEAESMARAKFQLVCEQFLALLEGLEPLQQLALATRLRADVSSLEGCKMHGHAPAVVFTLTLPLAPEPLPANPHQEHDDDTEGERVIG